MKKILVFSIILFISNFLCAQNIFPSFEDHPEWNVQRSIEPSLPGPVFILSYQLEKDTTINQKTYSMVSRTGNQQPHLSYERVGFIRSDAKKVFFKKSAEGKEYLLYDFGLSVGDTAYFPFFETDSAKYKVLKVDSVNINGIKRLRLKVLPEYYPEEYMSLYWIEGIGALWNPFYHDSFGVGGVSDEVRCVSTDAGQLYANPNYDDCTTVLRKTDCIVNEGLVWSGMIIYKDQSGKDSVASYHIKFDRDTILNDRTYTKIWQSKDSLGVNWNVTGLIREVEKRVYYHKLNDDGFYDMLLYDFSVKTGSTLLLSSIESQGSFENMKITNVDSVTVNGVKRLRIELSDGTDSDTWIEKIGSLQGIINHCYFEPVSIERILLCVQENGKTIYSNNENSKCNRTEFAPIGAEWHYNYRESMQGPETGYYLIKSVKDTVVDSKTCRVLSHTLVNSKGFSSNEGQSILYQDSRDNKVYRFLFGKFYLLYDFTKEAGDTIVIKEPLSATQYDSIVTVIDSVGIEIISDNIQLKSFYVSSVQGRKYDFEGKIIENIGNLLFLFPLNQLECDGGCPMPLRCYNDNEISFISQEPYVQHVPCDFIYTSGISDEIPEFIIYPNPFTNEITIEFPRAEPLTIEILNSGGQKVFEDNVSIRNRFQINLSAFPAGFYFVKAFSGKKVRFQKIIKHN